MTNAEARIIQLEQQIRRLKRSVSALEAQVAALSQAIRTGQPGGFGGGGGGGDIGFVSTGVVISAGSTATANISIRSGGSTVTLVTGATIYNPYASATTSGKALAVGRFADDTWLVLAQGC